MKFVLKLIQQRIERYEKQNGLTSKTRNNWTISTPSPKSTSEGKMTIFSKLFGNKSTSSPSSINRDDDDAELSEIYEKLSKLKLTPEVDKVIQKELNRLKKIPVTSPEYHVIRTYIETLIDIPWTTLQNDDLENINLSSVKKLLDERHYGLEEVKKRILQYVAVLILTRNRPEDFKKNKILHYEGRNKSGPTILCLLGPPGVGKTSLAKSIAQVLNRPFEKISLGGLHDEAEIRGHRRTYIGSFPGNLIQAIRRAGCLNPVILLDEIDKIGNSNGRGGGDPQAALLEALDPDQNSHFSDHYIGLPIDLSHVVFIATANYVESISPPLLDRMDVISISSYSNDEKQEIALRYLVPKQIQANGINSENLKFSKEGIYIFSEP